MNINGKKVVVQKSQQALYEFLSDLKNFEKLMPDSIQKFEVDGDSFLFGLKGMPEIRLILKEKINQNEAQINTSNLYPSSYILKVENDGVAKTSVIIKK